jgi:DNA repair photolyase
MKQFEAKSVLNKQKRRDDWFLTDYSLNPFSGCTMNCTYCYIRGSKYGENMASTFSVKSNAVELLEKQLKRRAEKRQYGFIAISSATDPYLPVEQKLQVTKRLLDIILKYRFPVAIGTKSSLVLRDLQILKEIDKSAILPDDLKRIVGRGEMVSVSVSTLDEGLAGILEPAAPSPRERLEVVRKCVSEGLFTGIAYMPVLPFLSDSAEHLEVMIRSAKECEAQFVFVGALTLFGNGAADSKTLYYSFLKKHHPQLIQQYKSLYRVFFSPSKNYVARIEETARNLCAHYGVRHRLA